MDYDIFISYSRYDLELVKDIKEEIELATDARCWMDLEGIEAGNPSFTDAIIDGIEQTTVFLFMRSAQSQESKYALKELNYASEDAREQGQKHVVIVNIDNSPMNRNFRFHYSLTDTIAWNDLPQREKLIRNIIRWTGRKSVTMQEERFIDDAEFQKILDENVDPTELNDLGNSLCRWNIRQYAKAVLLFQKAADMEYADAQNNLGRCYENGRGVVKDYQKAVFLYTKAAEQGHRIAQYRLARCYDNTESGFYNHDMAIQWYRKAAKQGCPDAQEKLGLCYLNGKGVRKNARCAVKWLTKAAEQGIDTAQFYLGRCYQYGTGVPQDIDEAYKWYSKAATQGHPVAQYLVSKIKKG